jgi:hypothetical protein
MKNNANFLINICIVNNKANNRFLTMSLKITNCKYIILTKGEIFVLHFDVVIALSHEQELSNDFLPLS